MTPRKGYLQGTHRAVAPEATLAALLPLGSEFGITRLADVTGVDRLGIPVYAAIRPRGRALQVSNGKGLRPVDAKVAALMAAIELSHAEAPRVFLRHASLEALASRKEAALAPGDVDTDILLPWIRGERLGAGEPIWIPGAACAFFLEPEHLKPTKNGLASGNTLTEATLHGLYEVIERDALGRLEEGDGQLNFTTVDSLPLDAGLPDLLGPLVDRCASAGLELRLLHVGDQRPLHTFMAVLLDPHATGASPSVNLGYGTHLSPAIAACRAITGAARARLVAAHTDPDEPASLPPAEGEGRRRLYRFFADFEPDATWDPIEDAACDTLEEDLAKVLGYLEAAGLWPVYRAVLSDEGAPFVVAKTIVSGSRTSTLRG